MTEKDFIEKVERQRGWVDLIDIYRLIHFFTEKWGVEITNLPIEDELMYMWMKLREDKSNRTKVCYKCRIEKCLDDYHYNNHTKDNRSSYCKVCMNLKSREYTMKKKNKLEI